MTSPDATGAAGRYRLFGTPTSYYTAKVRAYLRFKGLPFDEVLTTASVYEDVIVPRTGVWMIPVLITPDDIAIQDSTAIIDHLEQRVGGAAVYPATPRQRLAALLLELFGDEWLILTAIHYRWTKPENTTFVTAEFGRQAVPLGSAAEQAQAGASKAAVFSAWVDRLGSGPATGPKIEEAYAELLDALDAHFAQHAFLFGARPSIADFSFFGALYAVLYRDPWSGRFMRDRAPRVAAWVGRMLALSPEDGAAGFLDADMVPATLLPVLRQVFRDQFPVLQDTVAQVEAWAAQHPGAPFPKTIGLHPFQLRGAEGRRCIFPYAQWMLQRPLDYRHSLPEAERRAVDELLAEVGGIDAMRMTIHRRVTRRDNLVVADDDAGIA